jgi:predicted O-methyltransferase YrrM
MIYRYIIHFLFAKRTKGYGIHSPFVYDIIKSIFGNKTIHEDYSLIENTREKIKRSKDTVVIKDHGHGSRRFKRQTREVKKIVKYSSVNKRQGMILYQMVKFFKPDYIIELGTSVGISTLYLAKGNKKATVYTVEGDSGLCKISSENFNENQCKNIEMINDTFDHALPGVLKKCNKKTIVFIDGNHSYEATLKYFYMCIKQLNDNSIIIIDDINWSKGMRRSWKEIEREKQSYLTIDLFFMGIVFLNERIKKQSFRIFIK